MFWRGYLEDAPGLTVGGGKLSWGRKGLNDWAADPVGYLVAEGSTSRSQGANAKRDNGETDGIKTGSGQAKGYGCRGRSISGSLLFDRCNLMPQHIPISTVYALL